MGALTTAPALRLPAWNSLIIGFAIGGDFSRMIPLEMIPTNRLSARGVIPLVFACCCATKGLHAQTTNSQATNAATAAPTLASTSRVTVSNYPRPTPRVITRADDPTSAADPRHHFDWWPRKGTDEWIEYAFEKEATVSESQVYWFDDAGQGECRIPVSWRILYKDTDQWKPVETTNTYVVSKGKYDKITFKPVATTGLRLEVKFQPDWSAGVESWKVK
jgi:hypothetical protein